LRPGRGAARNRERQQYQSKPSERARPAHAKKLTLVGQARPRHFAGHSGLLVLSLNRKHWPTKVSFFA
jgi:hypothetical protein